MRRRAPALVFLFLLLATPLLGQVRVPKPLAPETDPPQQADSGAPVWAPSRMVEPGSPRHAMGQFFELANEGNWLAASRYLSLPPGTDSAKASALAERLTVVLDRYLWVEVDELSPHITGDTADGLTPGTEQLGVIPRPNGRYEPVRLVRTVRDDQPVWVFAPSTVRRVDAWYAGLEDNWLRELVPDALRRTGPLRVQWWQWLALLLAVPLVVVAGTVLERSVMLVVQWITRRTVPSWDDDLAKALRSPLLLFCVALFVGPVLAHIGLNASVQGFVAALIKALVTAALFWAVIRALNIMEQRVIASAWALQRADVLSLAPLGARLARILVGFLGVTAVLSQFSIPVGTLLAGLGIGGIAVALGAQKTLENVIGSLAIVGDKPFEVGDWVKVEDIEGTVEAVRLRSTRIRTFDRTLVTYPNGRLADMRIESYAARDRFRLQVKLGVVYGTTRTQVESIAAEIEAWLRAHPSIWPDLVYCKLATLGDSALVFDVSAWFVVPDIVAFRPIRQDALLAMMEIVEKHGSAMAFPTRTVVMAPTEGVKA